MQRRVGLDSHRIGAVALAVSGGSQNSVLACCVAPASASRSPGTEHILFVERARMGCGRGKDNFVPCDVHLAATTIRAAAGPAGPGGALPTRATPTSPARMSGFTSCLHHASSSFLAVAQISHFDGIAFALLQRATVQQVGPWVYRVHCGRVCAPSLKRRAVRVRSRPPFLTSAVGR